jgi:hypothetical protein
MIKNLILFSLLAAGLFLILVGDLRLMLIGVFVGIVALDVQGGFNATASIERFTLMGIGIDKNFETLETRLTEHLDALETALNRSITEIEQRLANNR